MRKHLPSLYFMALICLAFAAGFAACTPSAPSFSEADASAIRQSVRQFAETMLAGNWTAWSALMTDDVVFLVPNAAPVEGRAAVRAFGEGFPHLTAFTAEVVEVTGRGDLAISRGTYSLTAKPATAAPITDKGKFLTVYQRKPDGSWHISRNIWNSDLALSAPK